MCHRFLFLFSLLVKRREKNSNVIDQAEHVNIDLYTLTKILYERRFELQRCFSLSLRQSTNHYYEWQAKVLINQKRFDDTHIIDHWILKTNSMESDQQRLLVEFDGSTISNDYSSKTSEGNSNQNEWTVFFKSKLKFIFQISVMIIFESIKNSLCLMIAKD